MDNSSPLLPTHNHANEAVPEPERVGGLKIGLIIVGVSITLPAFLVGAEILHALGWKNGLIAIGGAAVILLIVGSMTMMVGGISRLSTYSLIQFSFGVRGARFVNLLLALTLLGWFGVTAQMFGATCASAIQSTLGWEWSSQWLTLAGGAVMVMTAIYGFSAIDRLSRVVVPLMLILLIMGCYQVFRNYTGESLWAFSPRPNAEIHSIGIGISAVVGAFMVGVCIAPDMARFSKRPADSIVAAFCSYGTFSPLVLVIAGLPVMLSGSKDLMSAYQSIGLGLPALIILVLATWTTNVNNLYSTSLGLSQVFPRVRANIVTLLAGGVGTAVGLAGIMEYFVGFLLVLGALIPPVAGIYLVDFFSMKRRDYRLHNLQEVQSFRGFTFLAWIMGAGVGLLSSYGGISLTGISALDSLLCAGAVYMAVGRFGTRQAVEFKGISL